MQEILSLLQKMEQLCQDNPSAQIEKDLLLQYTRDLYERILLLEFTPNIQQADFSSTDNETVVGDAIEKNQVDTKSLPDFELYTDNTALSDAETPEATEIVSDSEEEYSDLFELEDELMVDNDEINTLFEIYDDLKQEAVEAIDATEAKNEPEESVYREIISLTGSDQQLNAGFSSDEAVSSSEKGEEINNISTVASLQPLPQKPIEFKLWQKDIRSYIGINDKYNFISELFDNNAEAYEEILNEINLIETKEEAILFLENSGVTTLYQWHVDGFSEQVFYNILSQFFSSK